MTTTIWVLPLVIDRPMPTRPNLPAAWPRVFWGPENEEKIQDIEWWLITERAQENNTKNVNKKDLEKKQKKKEKPNSIHYKESQGDSRLMSKRENDIILTKHKFHTTLDWLAVRSHTGGTVSQCKFRWTPCTSSCKHYTSHPPLLPD